MPNVTLLLGSNLGDRALYLRRARAFIAADAGAIINSTPELESEPWGYASDNVYRNQVVVISTNLEPLELLDALLAIENRLGRVRSATARYTDRTIDIDILYYDSIVFNHPRLTIPHPRIAERPFVKALLSAL